MICFNYKSDKDDLKDDLNMSNGGTSMFINVLCLSGGRIAETESQKNAEELEHAHSFLFI